VQQVPSFPPSTFLAFGTRLVPLVEAMRIMGRFTGDL
jgi:hypothetical protein